jgi:catechol 2,3-dioxygenase-like lactoylglutathione lyase family enzyme
VEILAGRVLVRPTDPERSLAFYRDVLGLAVYREFPGGTVFFLGGGYLEVSGRAESAEEPSERACQRASVTAPAPSERACERARVTAPARSADRAQRGSASERVRLWVQVRDLAVAHRELVARGATVLREPRREPWGLDEMWLVDPDGLRIGVIEVPPEHPLRRDPRP